ncbi:hypothetical protein TGDOM2_218940 [Toxoplasma gondii GAB2-2007-GAL-DOM2]|uniref:Uncharacterized protein n=8 Tax=Toxoplasma gondii TaxID=5811 RepID=B9PQJ7_TOXGV|nr:hypothetical protein TGGT1_218940 [Toxoplasma gondii GT1]ESS28876.1 hypothetical protein TGVEG_218940 [Toxoplasma gondii VEG]KAF4638249.1 hypothetical protein TGRH88_058560 [Toxoplasma gondii]KFG38214.1 hypothetical protein TGP89_218940 [Toxoplasma gondii p89]KFG47615.1 hypothetical protein TGDOM2_218940 [Toxoplasma gondii GAB2-2007-GAL-DOM2]PUA88779.1 hypothetical protein TGBR9_218940 [Toxoplasma gondii TgCATBr9]RQX71703.1 hypothetical protein TGCAST_218940 [Toxoplasma gondii CAST]
MGEKQEEEGEEEKKEGKGEGGGEGGREEEDEDGSAPVVSWLRIVEERECHEETDEAPETKIALSFSAQRSSRGFEARQVEVLVSANSAFLLSVLLASLFPSSSLPSFCPPRFLLSVLLALFKDKMAGDAPAAAAAPQQAGRTASASGVRTPGYLDLVGHSLKATSMDHGMQYSSIYWETSHRTYLPFWASLTQKFSWKIMDDQIRSFLRLPKPVTTEPFVFSSGSPYIRRYFGDADISVPVPLHAPAHFAFVPTGTVSPWEETGMETGPQGAAARGAAATAFRAVLESAWKCDIDEQIKEKLHSRAGAGAFHTSGSTGGCPIPTDF